MNTITKENPHKNGVKGFHLSDRAWYAGSKRRDEEPSITIGIYHFTDEGGNDGCSAEFSIEWHNLGAGGNVPRICMFSDSWDFFTYCPELYREFAKHAGKNLTYDEVANILKELQYKDLTQYTRK